MQHAAKLLAQALDGEDYETALRCLSPDCEYELRGESICGAARIIDSYRSNGQEGRRNFDSIEYESSVTPTGPDSARIDYVDILTLDGDTHVHRCSQDVILNAEGLVSHVVHIDPDGEREALQQFLERHS